MNTFDAQKVISKYRNDAIVVATMSAHFEWPLVTTKPELDMLFSVMGKASSLALGLAMGKPDNKVLLLDGDGSLLINLGTLVTIVDAAPKNLVYFLLDNGCYRCCPPNYDTPNSRKTNFAMLAEGSGFSSIYTADNENDLDAMLPEILEQEGPVFVWIKCSQVKRVPEQPFIWPPLFVDNFIEAVRKL